MGNELKKKQRHRYIASYSNTERQDICSRYDSGESASSIAKSYNTTDFTIRKYLRNSGRTIRLTNASPQSRKQVVIDSYAEGSTVTDAADAGRVTNGVAFKWIVKAGIYRGKAWPRPRKDADKKKVHRRIATALRTRITKAIKRKSKRGSAVADLGCTIAQFIEYIASKFEPGMSWDNWGPNTWHIDHIKPLAKFDLTKRCQLLKAVHYTNLRPLWASENLLRRHEERRAVMNLATAKVPQKRR